MMCFHSFHWQCIKSWLSKKGQCPVCQFDLREHLRG
ncbi:MAG: hypothetical protein KDD45_05615 [Bdellovibrionales bacterium]|nr:hypothetical protein [Bdellovibrionales bacterium]